MMFKFYASQDKANDYANFDLEYLHKVLSFKELVRWGYQQSITPNFISPEDMVHIYKNLVRENEETTKSAEKTSGFVDMEGFKKAIVRISAMAFSPILAWR